MGPPLKHRRPVVMISPNTYMKNLRATVVETSASTILPCGDPSMVVNTSRHNDIHQWLTQETPCLLPTLPSVPNVPHDVLATYVDNAIIMCPGDNLNTLGDDVIRELLSL